MREYMLARELVDQMARKYQTEYSAQFQPWGRSSPTNSTQSQLTVGKDAVAAGVHSGQERDNTKPNKRHSTLGGRYRGKNTLESKEESDRAVDLTRIQSIYQTMIPAGLAANHANRSAYTPPPIKDDKQTAATKAGDQIGIPPTSNTYELALDVLKRAQTPSNQK